MVQDFYTELAHRDLSYILRKETFSSPKFIGEEKVFKFLLDIQNNPHYKILIYGDYDVDGLCSALIMKDTLQHLGCFNYSVFHYRSRTHQVDREAVRQAIQQHCDYMIICDAGSSDLETIKELISYNIKVILLDHHNTPYFYEDYGDSVAVINTMIENALVSNNNFALSAGALCFCVCDKFIQEVAQLPELKSIIAYALISLYSDCMDMSNILNRKIYYKAISIEREELPIYVQHFMSEYQSFSSRFIQFWFAPRINAAFRSEQFDALNHYFFENLDTIQRAKCIEIINDQYVADRKMTGLLADLVDVVHLKNFVYCNLQSAQVKSSLPFKNIHNYTGLVANKLNSIYGKTAVVFCEYGGIYKGSLRDQFSRNYLRLFQNICYAAGHNSAFGIQIKLLDLPNFIKSLELIDARYSIEAVNNEPIIINYNYNTPDSVLIEDIALYNEFSGHNLPVALLSKQLIGNMPETQTSYYYRYAWGDYFVQSEHKLDFGSDLLLKPIKSKTTKLICQ